MYNKILVDKPKAPFALYRKKKRNYTITLTKKGDQIWACGECGVLFTPWGDGDNPKKRAAECCLQQYCSCGNKIEKGYIGPKCSLCNRFDSYKYKIDKAIEINTFEGPVYDDQSDKYWSSLDEFEDWVTDTIDDGDEDSIPDWIFPCEVRNFEQLDAMDLIQSHLEDAHHEDASDHLVDIEEFEDFLSGWCEKQVLQSYYPDYSRKINVLDFKSKLKSG